MIKYIKKTIQHLLLKKQFRLENVFNFNFFNQLLYLVLKKNKQIKYVQIGANDGVRFDLMYQFLKYNSAVTEGLVVEPVKDYYNDLVMNYKISNT